MRKPLQYAIKFRRDAAVKLSLCSEVQLGTDAAVLCKIGSESLDQADRSEPLSFFSHNVCAHCFQVLHSMAS